MSISDEPRALRAVDEGEHFNDNGEFVANRKVRAARAPYDMEGQQIDFATIKLTGVNGLEIDDRIMKVDDVVELKITGRVHYLSFPKDEKSGKVTRVHVVHVIQVDYEKSFSPAGGIEFT